MRKNWQPPPGDYDKSLCHSVLEAKNVPVTVPAECSYHTDISSPNSTMELPKCTGINNHPINLIDAKQPSYALPSHPLPLRILFIRKIDSRLWLCVWGLNYLTMKNRYLLFLIKALPAWLKCQFRQEVRFLGYVVSSLVALTFRCLSNLYWHSIPRWKIASPLTSMLKTSGSTESITRPGKGKVGDVGNGGDDGGHDNGTTSSSSSTDTSTSTIQIAVEYDGVDGGGSKWVKELSKSQKTSKA